MKRLLIIALIAFTALSAQAQILAIKTNALADVLMAPNVGFELAVSSSASVNVNAYVGYKLCYGNRDMQVFNPEFRYYPMSKVMHKFFFGVSTLYAHYDMEFSEEKFMGDAVGGGLTFGWVFPLTEYHWNIEVEACVGAFYYEHKRSYLSDFQDPERRSYNEHGIKFMPYKLGVNFCYIFKYHHEVDSQVKRVARERKKREEALQRNPLSNAPSN